MHWPCRSDQQYCGCLLEPSIKLSTWCSLEKSEIWWCPNCNFCQMMWPSKLSSGEDFIDQDQFGSKMRMSKKLQFLISIFLYAEGKTDGGQGIQDSVSEKNSLTLTGKPTTGNMKVSLSGENICIKHERFVSFGIIRISFDFLYCSYTVEQKVSAQVPYQVRTYSWCWSLPSFRCSRLKVQMKTELRTMVNFENLWWTSMAYSCIF